MNDVSIDVNVTYGRDVNGGSKVLLVPVDTPGAACEMEVAVVVTTVPKEKTSSNKCKGTVVLVCVGGSDADTVVAVTTSLPGLCVGE